MTVDVLKRTRALCGDTKGAKNKDAQVASLRALDRASGSKLKLEEHLVASYAAVAKEDETKDDLKEEGKKDPLVAMLRGGGGGALLTFVRLDATVDELLRRAMRLSERSTDPLELRPPEQSRLLAEVLWRMREPAAAASIETATPLFKDASHFGLWEAAVELHVAVGEARALSDEGTRPDDGLIACKRFAAARARLGPALQTLQRVLGVAVDPAALSGVPEALDDEPHRQRKKSSELRAIAAKEKNAEKQAKAMAAEAAAEEAYEQKGPPARQVAMETARTLSEHAYELLCAFVGDEGASLPASETGKPSRTRRGCPPSSRRTAWATCSAARRSCA